MTDEWTADRLRELRESTPRNTPAEGRGRWERCISRADFAGRLGVSMRTLQRWETGSSKIPLPVQRLLSMLVREL